MSDTTNETTGQAISAFQTDLSSDITAVKLWIQNAGTTVVVDVENAYNWLKTELAALEPTVAADLKAAVNAALNDAVAGGSTLGTVVADTLDILANDGTGILSKVKSNVVTTLIGLTASPAISV